MKDAMREIADAVAAAVRAGPLSGERAERLMGQMLLDAAGADLTGGAGAWRREPAGLELPGSLIEEARLEVMSVAAGVEARPSARASAVRGRCV